jgi:hypothetical protein
MVNTLFRILEKLPNPRPIGTLLNSRPSHSSQLELPMEPLKTLKADSLTLPVRPACVGA